MLESQSSAGFATEMIPSPDISLNWYQGEGEGSSMAGPASDVHTFETTSPLMVVQEHYAASANQDTGDWGIQRRFAEACADPITLAAVR